MYRLPYEIVELKVWEILSEDRLSSSEKEKETYLLEAEKYIEFCGWIVEKFWEETKLRL